MYCHKCNSYLEDSAKFCTTCGAAVSPTQAFQSPVTTNKLHCPNCNANLPDGSAFCTSCGTKIGTAAPQQTPTNHVQSRKLHCPNCKSHNIAISTESSITAATTVGQGNFASTMVSNNHKNFWFCSDCGTKFRNIQNLEEEIAKENKSLIVYYIGSPVAFILFIVLLIVNNNYFGDWGFLTPLISAFIFTSVIAVVFFIAIFFTKSKIKKLNAEREYLKVNCFN